MCAYVRLISDQEGQCSGEEASPGNVCEVLELLISGEEGHTVNIAVVLDLAVHLVNKECLDGIVELVFPEVIANIFHGIVGPVGMLNSVQEAVVLGNPETVLEGLKVDSRVKAVS